MSSPALTEAVADRVPLAASSPKVDRETFTVRGVRLVGTRSRNGWKYPEAVLKRAVGLFDNAPVKVGHYVDPKTRTPTASPVEAKFARIVNPRFEDGGIRGDIRYNPKHQFTEPFLWACEHDPGFYALSNNSHVRRLADLDADGEKVADEWLMVYAVDVVDEGAATETIFDSPDPNIPPPPGSAPVALDPKAIAAQLTTPDQLQQFLAALFGSLDGIDPAAKAGVLEALIAAMTKTMPDVPTDGTADNAVADSLDRLGSKGRRAAVLVRQVIAVRESTKRREWADDLIEKAGLDSDFVTDEFAETVADCFGDERKAKARIADRARFAGAGSSETVADSREPDRKQPRSSPPGKKKTIAELADAYAAGD